MLLIEVKDEYNSVSFDLSKVTFVQETFVEPPNGIIRDVGQLKGLEVNFIGGEPMFLEAFNLKNWQSLVNDTIRKMQLQQPGSIVQPNNFMR